MISMTVSGVYLFPSDLFWRRSRSATLGRQWSGFARHGSSACAISIDSVQIGVEDTNLTKKMAESDEGIGAEPNALLEARGELMGTAEVAENGHIGSWE